MLLNSQLLARGTWLHLEILLYSGTSKIPRIKTLARMGNMKLVTTIKVIYQQIYRKKSTVELDFVKKYKIFKKMMKKYSTVLLSKITRQMIAIAKTVSYWITQGTLGLCRTLTGIIWLLGPSSLLLMTPTLLIRSKDIMNALCKYSDLQIY